MQEPLETAELLAFTRTVDAHSLSRAAAELGAPRATISRRLARLEARLGVRLLRRTTRSLVLTEAGEAFYRHARLVLESVQRAEESVLTTDGVIRGDLRVSIPPSPSAALSRILTAFVLKYPRVRMLVEASTRHVDMHRDGYDVAIRAAFSLEPGLVARVLAKSLNVAVASPAYLRENGVPSSLRDLRKHRCVLGFTRGELPQTHWVAAGGRRIAVEGVLSSNDIGLQREAVLAGVGIGYLSRFIVDPDIAAGRLVVVLPDVLASEVRVSVIYPEREFVPPQVRAFVDMVSAWTPSFEEFSDTLAKPQASKRAPQKSAQKTAKKTRA